MLKRANRFKIIASTFKIEFRNATGICWGLS